jgi:hypothetical protein
VALCGKEHILNWGLDWSKVCRQRGLFLLQVLGQVRSGIYSQDIDTARNLKGSPSEVERREAAGL